MNCADFESIVVAIARGEMAEDAARADAVAHVETCPRCGRRLAGERMLSGTLRAVRAEDAACGAPPVVEKILLAAFRERQAAGSRQRQAGMTRAMAAVAALLAVVAILTLRHPQPQRMLPARSITPGAAPPQLVAPVYREAQRPPVRTLRAAHHKAPRRLKAGAAAEEREMMTDFIPLVYDPSPIELGRLVRVRLPRAALVAFGLPVNELRAEEPIQADVLLGDDGLARAVRFVR
jgi:hypothetical protein